MGGSRAEIVAERVCHSEILIPCDLKWRCALVEISNVVA